MERRKFLGWVGIGMLASSIPVVIAACSSDGGSSSTTAETSLPTVPTTPEIDTTPDAEGFVAVGTSEELTTKGYIYDKQLGVIVVSDNGEIAALSPTCPHQGCDVDWKKNELVCPCHGSKFDVGGNVLAGPAKEPLPVYQFKQEGDLIKVKLA